ncbi:MAG: aconitate hydratase [Planctomycetes bacterium]|nr:aconitate hydratase [Planctomycetota bacterium]
MHSHDCTSAIARLYSTQAAAHAAARASLGRALTLAEKILVTHLDPTDQALTRGKSNLDLRPDRVAMQDATAQMALLQFLSAGLDRVAVPTTVHCDHLIRARVGAGNDLAIAETENAEVFDFLRSASARAGIGFWKPGSGIIHQVILENYAFPGGLIIGTDSHTPNAGGLGMLAVGVGGADAVDVMAGLAWNVRSPKLIGVHLKGQLSGWTAPKDVILRLAGMLTVAGGTGAIIEYFGAGCASLSCTGKATITNMGAELGATCSVFPFDARMAAYLRATARNDIATLAEAHASELCADADVAANPQKYFDQVVEIDLDTLEPHVVGPHTPDLARPVSAFAADLQENDWPVALSAALIGSCTNSSYEDLGRAAHLVSQARAAGLSLKSPLLISPGSIAVHATIERDGILGELNAAGATVLANACGPCIGQWKRDDSPEGTKNSIITSFNRNFQARNDGNTATCCFIASPEIVMAMALAGRLDFNPLKDSLTTADGRQVKLTAPTADELPSAGFASGSQGFIPAPRDTSSVKVNVAAESQRLALLSPFPAWDGQDILGVPVLMKAAGKCTTDHISAAGKWLSFRGHLERISDNMFLGAKNAFDGATGKGLNVFSGVRAQYSAVARDYKARNSGWIAVGDTNYGEGSSREHAAMSPRWLGARAVIVRSFARIHETNLKKQGILPFTFADPADYAKFLEEDRVDIVGLAELAPNIKVRCVLHHKDGTCETIMLDHSMTPQQIDWFKAGSALNLIRTERAARR